MKSARDKSGKSAKSSLRNRDRDLKFSDLELCKEREYTYELHNLNNLNSRKSRDTRINKKYSTLDSKGMKENLQDAKRKKSKPKRKYKNSILDRIKSKSKTPKALRKSEKFATNKNSKKATVQNSTLASKRNS